MMRPAHRRTPQRRDPLYEARNIVCVLLEGKIVALSVPRLWKIMAQAQGEDAVLGGKGGDLLLPVPEGAPDKNERRTVAVLLIGKRIAPNFDGL